ncbi:hypothetical protein UQW22_17910 [Isoptericola halotolerans]|uniref:hypothetical protein n=1 Tax=Isoptericola halotolerans TaxID=300560 RepID=UPI00388E558D
MPTEASVARDLLYYSGARDSGFDRITEADDAAEVHLREVQNAIRAANESSDNALFLAGVMNRLLRKADGKSTAGRWTASAVDSVRSALLYASAGLDVSLKRLVRHALPMLPDIDSRVEVRFQKWAEVKMQGTNGSIDAQALIRVLMTKGESPRDSLMTAWVADLTAGSAQSAQRVAEIAQALGVTDPSIMKRVQPGKSSRTVLEGAFEARNLIAHELDVIDPDAEVRKRLENIRQYRGHDEIAAWCVELLDLTQLIANNVAKRLDAAV